MVLRLLAAGGYNLQFLNHQITKVHHIAMVLKGNFALLEFAKSRHALELALRNQCLPLWSKQLRRDNIHSVQKEV